jgi:hypothetical protein
MKSEFYLKVPNDLRINAVNFMEKYEITHIDSDWDGTQPCWGYFFYFSSLQKMMEFQMIHL